MTSESGVKMIDLSKLVVDWFKGKSGNSNCNVDLNALKQTVQSRWTDISPVTKASNGITRKAELKYANHQQEIYSELGLAQNVQKIQSIKLAGVVMTGLAQPIRLPLSELPQEVREMFGDELTIRDEVAWEARSNHVTPELTSEAPMIKPATSGSRVAMVTTTECTCKCRFECVVKLKKSALIQQKQNFAQHKIACIVNDMKMTFPTKLEGINVYWKGDKPKEGNPPSEVTWILTGECEFSWGSQPQVVWT